jgi:glycosyltransferase involved in cell wall biosynthesis
MEYVNASRILNGKYSNIEFCLLGPLYERNGSGISKEELSILTKNSFINYLGSSDNVENEMQCADCIVLPSYREGLSKVLIEASSMGLPIVTTDVPGCRDVVIDNTTGFLCKPKSIQDLVDKMEKMYLLSFEDRKKMSINSRRLAENKFDEKIVFKLYSDVIDTL